MPATACRKEDRPTVSLSVARGATKNPTTPARSHVGHLALAAGFVPRQGVPCRHHVGGGPWRGGARRLPAVRGRPLRACSRWQAPRPVRQRLAGLGQVGRAHQRRCRRFLFAGTPRPVGLIRRGQSPICPRQRLVMPLWQSLPSTSMPRQIGHRSLPGFASVSTCWASGAFRCCRRLRGQSQLWGLP